MDGDFMQTLADPVFANYRRAYVDLISASESCASGIATAQSKIDGSTAELGALRETSVVIGRNREDVANHVKTVRAAIDEGQDKLAVLAEHEKQDRSRVEELYLEIEALKVRVGFGAGWSEDQQTVRRDVVAQCEALEKAVESKSHLLLGVRKDVVQLQELVDRAEREVEETAVKIAECEMDAERRRAAAAAEQRKKHDLERNLQKLQRDTEAAVAVLVTREVEAKGEERSIQTTEHELRESKREMERYLKDYEKLFEETQRLTEQLESLMYSNETIDSENEVRRRDVVAVERKIAALRRERHKVGRDKGSVVQKLEAVERQREAWERERDDLKGRIDSLATRNVRAAWREGETLKKVLEDLNREREILARKVGSSEKTAALVFDLTKVNQNAKKNLANEINGYTALVKEERAQIEALVHDRERHETEAKHASHRYYVALEQLKLQEVEACEIQRKIADGAARLKQQQNLYDAVRTDRNLYSKHLIQATGDIAEMKRRFKLTNHLIGQLKDEITAKDHALVKEHFNHHNVDKERESLRTELTKIRKQIVSSEQIVTNQRLEIQKLAQIIEEADEERLRQRKEHEAIVAERNVLGAQLITRNAELATVYEKIKVNWSGLQRGEARFAEALAEVDFLTEQIRAAGRERDTSATQMTNLHDLKSSIHTLESEVLRERTKVTSLQDELDRPLNVHRWRLLESSDPQRFEMIKKIQNLQRRIIDKNELTLAKELAIQHKEKLYVELKNILGRQPGPEVQDQLQAYQTNLKNKLHQMTNMTAELDMYKLQVNEFRTEIQTHAVELQNLNDAWISTQLAHQGAADQGLER